MSWHSQALEDYSQAKCLDGEPLALTAFTGPFQAKGREAKTIAENAFCVPIIDHSASAPFPF